MGCFAKPLESLNSFFQNGPAAARARWLASTPKLPYDWRPKTKKPQGRAAREDGMGILVFAACTLAVVWIIVLWGSRYFGPR
jgi:hypothetical protein